MKVLKTYFEVFEILKDEFCNFNLPSEKVSIQEAVFRICAQDIIAEIDVPHFDKSTVDGYALRCEETFEANDENPAVFEIVGEVKTGKVPNFQIQKGQAARIFTGGCIPQNANAIVMIENTIEEDGKLYVFKPAKPGENILRKGEDIKKDSIVIKKYQKLEPAQIGVLAAIGKKEVEVFKKIRVGIVSTGDEIISQDEKLDSAKIYDVNSFTLFTSCYKEYALPKMYGIVKDDFEALKDLLSIALQENDIVLISGGSSVGTYDNTLKAIESLKDSKVLVDGVSIKPGKPTIIAKVGIKAVFGLPGHPVSCLFIFNFFVKKLMDIILHQQDTSRKVLAKMKTSIATSSGRTEFVFVKLHFGDEILAEPLYGKSGSINLLNNASGYIRVDATKTGIRSGDIVEVILI
ncbi:molybdenum cofactor synthesis domain protein [Caldicellulosiruptor kronotskyensis 2002]|uniref:Molybdopterin molybdenumtransferase n=1 Tax=Caldicellulosiruptor kronotskyensis (strain DSM 18902 / VKM B-2412 / 2002) TaxID=632348 RepID=E4SFZ7_CALK2|nr:gephyrin-like molybdotransferase Glp [Caldicellulosiruptor kronotskyensis]ADQ46672.1 molybdenum cofactor synthesis domain protein [Caldicellulosiruptor kronotskyensis 2002]